MQRAGGHKLSGLYGEIRVFWAVHTGTLDERVEKGKTTVIRLIAFSGSVLFAACVGWILSTSGFHGSSIGRASIGFACGLIFTCAYFWLIRRKPL